MAANEAAHFMPAAYTAEARDSNNSRISQQTHRGAYDMLYRPRALHALRLTPHVCLTRTTCTSRLILGDSSTLTSPVLSFPPSTEANVTPSSSWMTTP
eukprot:5570668-Pleurochrysis_carterae.AAC.1